MKVNVFIILLIISLDAYAMEKQLPPEQEEVKTIQTSRKKRKLLEESYEEIVPEEITLATAQEESAKPMIMLVPEEIGHTPEELSAFERLPKDIQRLIIGYLVTAPGHNEIARLYNAAQNIRNLMMVNKQMKELFNNYDLQSYLIKELAKRYANEDEILAAIALSTPLAGEFLQKKMGGKSVYHYVYAGKMEKLLLQSAEADQMGVVRFLVTYNPYFSKNILGHVLGYVIDKGHEKFAEKLIKLGADVNAINTIGDTPLVNAIYRRNIHLVKQLIEAGADVNKLEKKENLSPLDAAILNDNFDLAQLLLETGKINPSVLTDAVVLAASYGELEAIKMLLAAGADINAPSGCGDTALIRAIEYEKFPMVEFILSLGADANKPEEVNKEMTPLWYAKNRIEDVTVSKQIVDLLKKYGAKE